MRLSLAALACINQHQQGPGRSTFASGIASIRAPAGNRRRFFCLCETATFDQQTTRYGRVLPNLSLRPKPRRVRNSCPRGCPDSATLFDIVKTETGCGPFVTVPRRGYKKDSPQRHRGTEIPRPSSKSRMTVVRVFLRAKRASKFWKRAMLGETRSPSPCLCASVVNSFRTQAPPWKRLRRGKDVHGRKIPCYSLFFVQGHGGGMREMPVVVGPDEPNAQSCFKNSLLFSLIAGNSAIPPNRPCQHRAARGQGPRRPCRSRR